jgi:hypothetical protein
MRVKLLSTARIKTKKVQGDLVLAQADLHESNTDLAFAAGGVLEPTRESVAAAVEQNAGVEAQLSDAVHELAAVSELLRVAEAKLDQAAERAIPVARSGEGVASLRAQLDAALRRPDLGETADGS